MAVVYAPKVDFVGRGVEEATATVVDNLLRAAITSEGTLNSDARIRPIILNLDGVGSLTAAEPSAERLLVSTGETLELTGQSALTSATPRNDDFRADLTGQGTIEGYPTRSALSGSGDVQATITGGQGVAFASADLSGSGATTATTAPITHGAASDIAGSMNLGVAGGGGQSLQMDLTGDSALVCDLTLNEAVVFPQADLVGETFVEARARKVIYASTRMTMYGILKEPPSLLVNAAPPSVEGEELPYTGNDILLMQTDARRITPDEPGGPPTGYDPLLIASDDYLITPDEPGVGTPLVINDPGDQTANEGQTLATPTPLSAVDWTHFWEADDPAGTNDSWPDAVGNLDLLDSSGSIPRTNRANANNAEMWDFGATNSSWVSASALNVGTGAVTWAFVWEPDTTTKANERIFYVDNVASDVLLNTQYSAGSYGDPDARRLQIYAGTPFNHDIGDINTGEAHLVVIVWDGASSYLYVDGVEHGPFDPGNFAQNVGAIEFGARADGVTDHFVGWMGFSAVRDGAITSEERSSLEAAVADKYGVVIA